MLKEKRREDIIRLEIWFMKMKVRILNVLISGNESNFFILKVCMNFNKRKNVFRVCVSRVFLKVYR